MKYYIIAGEASGDLHASNLMKALLRRDPQAEFRFWGGDLMSAVGGTPVKHYKDISFMGFWEVFIHLKTILGLMRYCKEDILSYAPDALILVDYPGFNLRIAKFAKKHKIPVFYYISPQIWAWKKGRIRTIRKNIDEMMVILPFEEAFYAKNGMKVHYVGHPLLDAITDQVRASEEVRKFRDTYQIGDREIIALLPGSRRQEITALLPQMLAMVPLFPQYHFVVSTVTWQSESLYDQYIKDLPVTRVSGSVYPLLANAKAAVVASGTATLETALFCVPQVVVYAGSEISYLIAKQLIKGISYISLPNLIADKPIVKELIQHDFDTRHLQEEMHKIIDNGQNIQRMIDDYRSLCQQLGNGSASDKAASVVLNFFQNKRRSSEE
ncbi:MAG: lipid-A-disaccharide synthase [Bacteroidales bacterium]|nr:lipid-A-disaccharide synthase [Bacteroidales bacterium]